MVHSVRASNAEGCDPLFRRLACRLALDRLPRWVFWCAGRSLFCGNHRGFRATPLANEVGTTSGASGIVRATLSHQIRAFESWKLMRTTPTVRYRDEPPRVGATRLSSWIVKKEETHVFYTQDRCVTRCFGNPSPSAWHLCSRGEQLRIGSTAREASPRRASLFLCLTADKIERRYATLANLAGAPRGPYGNHGGREPGVRHTDRDGGLNRTATDKRLPIPCLSTATVCKTSVAVPGGARSLVGPLLRLA